MASYNDFYGYTNNAIIVNGVKMTMKEYNTLRREKVKNKNKRKAKKQLNEIQLLPDDIKTLMKSTKVFKSLVAYYKNGYKQWGNIHREVLKIDNMGGKFILVVSAIETTNKHITEICNLAKRSNKAVFGMIQDLSYKMTDLQSKLMNLHNVVTGSGIIHSPFNTHEVINGKGRRLGLKILMYRTEDAIIAINTIIYKLQQLAVIPNSIYDNTSILKYGTLK